MASPLEITPTDVEFEKNRAAAATLLARQQGCAKTCLAFLMGRCGGPQDDLSPVSRGAEEIAGTMLDSSYYDRFPTYSGNRDTVQTSDMTKVAETVAQECDTIQEQADESRI